MCAASHLTLACDPAGVRHYGLKRAPVAIQGRYLTRERLPALDGNVHVIPEQLDGMAAVDNDLVARRCRRAWDSQNESRDFHQDRQRSARSPNAPNPSTGVNNQA